MSPDHAGITDPAVPFCASAVHLYIKPSCPSRPSQPSRPSCALARNGSRQGVALLLALAAVVLVLGSVVVGLGAARRATHDVSLQRAALSIDNLRADAEHILHAWCHSHGATIATPSTMPEQGQVILADQWAGPNGEASVTIVVWDALAGVPVAAEGVQAVAHSVLPPAWHRAPTSEATPATEYLDHLKPSTGLALWPQPQVLPTRHWSPQQTEMRSDGDQSGLAPVPNTHVPIAALALAPHSDGRINVRTANPDLIDAVLRQRQRDGLLPQLLAQRDAGQVPALPADLSTGDDGVRLVTTTDHWSALITIHVGSLQRSWWVICAGTGDDITTLQRHGVD